VQTCLEGAIVEYRLGLVDVLVAVCGEAAAQWQIGIGQDRSVEDARDGREITFALRNILCHMDTVTTTVAAIVVSTEIVQSLRIRPSLLRVYDSCVRRPGRRQAEHALTTFE
jgi:hypothetical protein